MPVARSPATHPGKLALLWLIPLCLLSLLLGAPAQATKAHNRVVDVIEVDGLIDPAASDYLLSRLRQAEDDRVHAAIIQLNTAGGLDASIEEIVEEMLGMSVPVIVWVAPRGAQAASAGTLITYAANLAFMSDAAEIKGAVPVNLGGDHYGTQQANERAAVVIDRLAVVRSRNRSWAADAARGEVSLGAEAAADIGVVDGVASSLRELFEDMDGRTVTTANGRKLTLETWDDATGALTNTVRFQHMSPWQQLLHGVATPEAAFLLLLAGLFGLIFELYNPGIGLAAIIGAVCLVLSFYGLWVLPTEWIAVLAIVAAVGFFVVDVQTAGLGAWTAAGVAALIPGALLLFTGSSLSVDGWVIAAAVAGTLTYFISVMTAALRVRLRRPVTGEESLIGEIGEAQTDIAPEGTVRTKGMLWRARTMETGIAAGSRVEVKASEGLVLLVEPLHEKESAPRASPSMEGGKG
ncbi:MAG: nodulation protein NfeD [Actinobacteria bacterium]|nr:nodulation protein NfeD [Actinomycetota bacterium]